ncbi:MAG: beta-ribofuranosylaminobenzene 5'-phosphate synthase [Candidatus Thorarchaeota archaeon]
MLQIEIKTPSRLHFGLIDLNGEFGRIDGGVGIALKEPGWHLTISQSDQDHKTDSITISGPQKSLLQNIVLHYLKQRGIPTSGYHMDVQKAIPSHVGLGSKTQLSLAIGSALEMLYQGIDKKPPVRQIARLMQRGGTSGIGVNSFANGGFCVDCGHSFGAGKEKESFLPSRASRAAPPPIVLKTSFPEEWHIVLAIPSVSPGASGESEIEIFRENCPIGSKDVEKLSRTVLMQIIPAILEKDIESLGEGLKTFQAIGFKRIEILQQNPIVQELIQAAEDVGSNASGMSSFGPTTFCVVENKGKAIEIREIWQNNMDEKMGGMALVTCANNTGAVLSISKSRRDTAKSAAIQIQVESLPS